MNHSLFQQNVLICNLNSVDDVRKYAELLISFLHEVSFLTEAYVLDYFAESLWSGLPSGWFDVISALDTSDLEALLSFQTSLRCKQPWPLSLLSLRAAAFALALPRQAIVNLDPVCRFLSLNFSCSASKRSPSAFTSRFKSGVEFSCNEFEQNSGQHKQIPEFCRRHVKPKKQHEIFRLAELTDFLLRHVGLNHVVDVGSGQGHLSRLLALCYDRKVTTVEANPSHLSGAEKFDLQAFKSLSNSEKRKETTEGASLTDSRKSLPRHVESTVTFSAANSSLRKVLNDVHPKPCIEEERFALAGLHTCGNLAETIIKTFVASDQCRALLSIGCCYMKLESDADFEGYPLSSFIKSKSHFLSYIAKEMACHALEMYIQRLHDNAPALKIHCYRATLEKCIAQHHPHARHMGLRGVKHAELMPFQEYARLALARGTLSVPESTLCSGEVSVCLSRWTEVLAFYSVRLLTAPIVENLMLVDRLLYLQEQGYPCCVVPIFDPCLSPRNQIILSAKPEQRKNT